MAIWVIERCPEICKDVWRNKLGHDACFLMKTENPNVCYCVLKVSKFSGGNVDQTVSYN